MGLAPRLVVSVVTEAQAAEIHLKHSAALTEFLYPRTVEFFLGRAADQELYAVREGRNWVGLCYLHVGADEITYEFGGLYVDEHLRGSGVTDRLGTLALSYYYAFASDPSHRLRALVHKDNQGPLKCLGRLGFEFDGLLPPFPGDQMPEGMRRDRHGKVVAKQFLHARSSLSRLADQFEVIDTDLPYGHRFGVEIDQFPADYSNILAALRNLAG